MNGIYKFANNNNLINIENNTQHIFLKKTIKELNSNNTTQLNKFMNQIEDEFIAICKKTGKEFNDYKNKSGHLIIHLNQLYPNLIIPSSFKRREFLAKNNKYWHEEFFIIIKTDKQQYKQCKYCDWKTRDLLNISGCYTVHLKKEHNIEIGTYLKDFSDEKKLFKTFLDKKKK